MQTQTDRQTDRHTHTHTLSLSLSLTHSLTCSLTHTHSLWYEEKFMLLWLGNVCILAEKVDKRLAGSCPVSSCPTPLSSPLLFSLMMSCCHWTCVWWAWRLVKSLWSWIERCVDVCSTTLCLAASATSTWVWELTGSSAGSTVSSGTVRNPWVIFGGSSMLLF